MAEKLKVANPSKAGIALAGLACITLLMLFERIASEAGTGMLGAIIGYAIGNGIAGAQGKSVTPMFGSDK